MKNKGFKKSEFIKALITGTVIAVPVFMLGYSRGYAITRALSDAFFVPAVLLLGIAGIMLARNDGQFDTMGYSIRYALINHIPALGEKEDIMDYKERKMKNRKSPLNIFLAGLIFLVIAVIFIVLNYI